MPELGCGSGAENIVLAVMSERCDVVGEYCMDDSTVNLLAVVRPSSVRLGCRSIVYKLTNSQLLPSLFSS